MTVSISPKDTNKSIEKKLNTFTSKKKFDAKKYFGKIKLKENPLIIQQRLRNEWK